jgi:D-aminopeptidase
VQTNFSGNLNIYGYPVPNGMHEMSQDGSCMIVVATDAPLDARQLKRVAKRGIAGMAQTGSYLANGSGDCMRRVHTPSLQGGVVDFCIAFSNYPDNITPRNNRMLKKITTLPDELINPLFEATCESVREAIYNSLTMAEGIVGKDCKCVQAIDMPKVAHQIKARS